MVFDIPNHKGTYEERYAKLGNHILFPLKVKLTDTVSRSTRGYE